MKFQKKTFTNGLRVIFVPMPNSLTTTALVLTQTGSKYETKRINGISHFLEHMCFKGTLKRGTAKVISEELDGLGAQYNAFTSLEYTGYYAKAESGNFKKILACLSDIYLNSVFPKDEIEKERGVIIGEIEMYEDTPRRHVWDLFTDVLYGNQPAGWNIAGTRETVSRMKRDDFVRYKESHYVAGSTIVVVAGNIDREEAFTEVREAFKTALGGRKYGKKKVRDIQSSPRVFVEYKDTSQAHLIVGFRSYDIYHKAYPTLQVLASLLGGGMSSRLFHRIRDEMGAGYYVGAENESLTDHGYFATFVGADNKRVPEIIEAILEEIKIVRDVKVSDGELAKVKNYLIGNMFSGLETSDALASFYGSAEVLKKHIKTPKEVAKEIHAVTAEQVQKVAQELFTEKHLNLALVGPFHASKRFRRLLSL